MKKNRLIFIKALIFLGLMIALASCVEDVITKPAVSTERASNVTTTSATLSAQVSSDGESTVSSRGFVYSTSPDPTRNDNVLNSGSGVGSYTEVLDGLTPGTTYFVRAFATNEMGTSLGNEIEFTTEQEADPVVNIELPESMEGRWYTLSGVWLYGIDANENGDYIRTGDVEYFYTGEDVEVLGDNVYKVTGTSLESSSKTFYLKEGENDNEIQISQSNENELEIYYKDPTVVGEQLPTAVLGDWYTITGTWLYSIGDDDAGDYIRTGDVNYYYTRLDVEISEGDIYVVNGTSDDQRAKTFYIQSGDTDNEIKVSQESADDLEVYYKDPTKVGNALPSSLKGNWYTIDGTWLYGISDDSSGDYIRTGNVKYYYTRLDVEILSGNVYQVSGTSSSEASKTFYLKNGPNSNEILVSQSSSDDLNTYYKDPSIVGTELPEAIKGRWYTAEGTWIYGIESDSNGDHIRTGNVLYYYDRTNVEELSGAVYQVKGTSTGGSSKTFYLKEGPNSNELLVSQNSKDDLQTYYKDPSQAGIDLPASMKGRWFNTAGTWIYGIDDDSNGEYIRTGNVLYYYSKSDVEILSGDVYKVNSASTSGAAKTFYLKEGPNSNEILISQSSATQFTTYYKDPSQAGADLPPSFTGRWFNFSGTWIWGLDSDSNGDYVRTGNVLYYYERSDVEKISNQVYKITATSTGGDSKTWYFKQGSDTNLLEVSSTSANSGYSLFAKVNGQTVSRVTHNNGSFDLRSGSTWEEKDPAGNVTFTFTEVSRDDWSVYLDDTQGRGRLQIDIFNKTTYWTPTGGTKGELYRLTGWFND